MTCNVRKSLRKSPNRCGKDEARWWYLCRVAGVVSRMQRAQRPHSLQLENTVGLCCAGSNTFSFDIIALTTITTKAWAHSSTNFVLKNRIMKCHTFLCLSLAARGTIFGHQCMSTNTSNIYKFSCVCVNTKVRRKTWGNSSKNSTDEFQLDWLHKSNKVWKKRLTGFRVEKIATG